MVGLLPSTARNSSGVEDREEEAIGEKEQGGGAAGGDGEGTGDGIISVCTARARWGTACGEQFPPFFFSNFVCFL